MEEEGKRG